MDDFVYATHAQGPGFRDTQPSTDLCDTIVLEREGNSALPHDRVFSGKQGSRYAALSKKPSTDIFPARDVLMTTWR